MTGERALSRRVLLRGGSAVVLSSAAFPALSGCTTTGHRATPGTPDGSGSPASTGPSASGDTPAPVSADVALLSRSLAEEQRLLAYCTEVAVRHPALVRELAPIRRVQREHVAVMQRALPRAFAQRTAPRVRVPRRLGRARAELVRSVQRAERGRLADCLAAESGLLARLFASASASHATTVELLAGRS